MHVYMRTSLHFLTAELVSDPHWYAVYANSLLGESNTMRFAIDFYNTMSLTHSRFSDPPHQADAQFSTLALVAFEELRIQF